MQAQLYSAEGLEVSTTLGPVEATVVSDTKTVTEFNFSGDALYNN